MKKLIEFAKSIFKSVIIGIILAILIINFLFVTVTVVGSSMEPNLNDGERGIFFIFDKKLPFIDFNIERFDVVVIDNELSDYYIVKRVIGLPNEKITYENNKLYVNDVYVEEPFLEDDALTNNLEIKLKDNEYFCLGDNRIISKDSRYYGPFTIEQILSKRILILYPFENAGLK